MQVSFIRLLQALGLAGLAALVSASGLAQTAKKPASPSAKLLYNRDIRPILAENCFPCHGPDSAARKAGLRIDSFAEATASRSGSAPIVPGKPGQSLLVNRIKGFGNLMPPPSTKKTLSKLQVAALERWIAQGARYELHWSYLPPQRPALPKVQSAAWVRNPIDRFVLARLEAAGLSPAPEADRRSLARRASLDLTGLPPEPSEVEAFVKDRAPGAYEKYVDKLLENPAWGEHRGRYWLDAARYADTHGIHFDNFREMWSYRDWVIRALNANMPFDEFTTLQLAGDLLPSPTLDQRIATGFIRCNITTSEGGAIDEEYRVLYARDRTETASFVWLGTTMNCAVCHDHKFDPFTMRDFYSMSAFFNNSTQNAMDGNIKDTPPTIFVPAEADRVRFAAMEADTAAARRSAEERKAVARPDFEKWAASQEARASVPVPTDGLSFHLPLAEGAGRQVAATLAGKPLALQASADPSWPSGHVAAKAFQRKQGSVIEAPQAGDFAEDKPFTVAAWVKLPNGPQGGAVLARMNDQKNFQGWDLWLEGSRPGTHIVSKWPTDALKVVSREPIESGKWQHLCVTYTGGKNVSAVQVYVNGASKPLDVQADSLKGSIRTDVPLKVGQRHTTAGVEGTAIQDIRLYDRVLTPDEVIGLASGTRVNYLAAKGAGSLVEADRDELFGWWLGGQDPVYRVRSARIAELQAEEAEIRKRGTIAHVFNEKTDEPMAYILARGDYDKRRDKVSTATPAVLLKMPQELPKNRLGLAKWLLLPEHPLTSRVTVNRFWQEVFGTGIVRTSGDFGVNGELPTHPELLDWLAIEFRDSGWDIKKLFKLLVTSATYRQSAAMAPEKKLKDPQNRLYSRSPRFRMDAEMVRDGALAASGLLVRKLGGPSVRPYQPDGVWEAVAMIGSNTRDYRKESGENLYRRSLYTFWKRAAPPASMDIFNAPNRETCVVRRERTNTPLQALVTLNDVQFVEAARRLAERAMLEGGQAPSARIDWMTLRLISRRLGPKEMAIAAKSLGDLHAFYRSNEKEAKELIATGDSKADASLDPKELAAYTMLANQLMNLDEVLNK